MQDRLSDSLLTFPLDHSESLPTKKQLIATLQHASNIHCSVLAKKKIEPASQYAKPKGSPEAAADIMISHQRDAV